ncbi:hydro-lyase, Fe-S type, tartrate/fumarate subfamily, alpha subunit [Methanococcus vannielii SB]|jgi:fumarate hydratase subunit alpha|uniref:Hydro-lyase, Fe-S type, tartrate/fumarate subfamily, alpha subunit n=1 Tax=Methanococcus vannielii (strain ATCC 35089 / DSM 1224 / JCM 13029 / OCM 148 / SB) TaxID=406327 RepID=A6URB3_METVS|nr:fumarate hydratase [Methanococcus vannielii]ABR55035.1 hydro-lyase, Fe-S type, tartrate/fumarate subfamily, alpha subunit [Methanococcus vannielii SB]
MTGIIANAVYELFKESVIYLPDDVKKSLSNAESLEYGVCKDTLNAIILNNKIAESKQIPLCQDTGVPVIFLKVGKGILTDKIFEIVTEIEEGVKKATRDIPLRPNVVHPITRENLKTNTGLGFPFINFEFDEDLISEVEISVFPKGAGSENMSALKMLTPSEGILGIKSFILDTISNAGGKPCPPIVLGIGIGGTADLSMKLAKKALLRDIGNRNKDETLSMMEKEILNDINNLGIGTMGLGGKITALDVFIEINGCHTASLPVGLCIQCWADRKASKRIKL